jgi:hypothetical protein
MNVLAGNPRCRTSKTYPNYKCLCGHITSEKPGGRQSGPSCCWAAASAGPLLPRDTRRLRGNHLPAPTLPHTDPCLTWYSEI